MTRAIHFTAIAVLVLAPLASVIGWGPLVVFAFTAVGGLIGMVLAAAIEEWLDGLEAEGL